MKMSNDERHSMTLGGAVVCASAVIAACMGSAGPGATTTDGKSSSGAAGLPRILIALTSHDKKGETGEPTGAYLPEIAHAHAVFVKAGYPVDFASVRGGRVPLDGIERPDAVSAAFLGDAATLTRLDASAPSAEVDPRRYAAVYFAGGHGAMWDLPGDAGFARVTAAIYEAGGVVGAVCHGPAALVDVRLSSGAYLVAGKTVSGFTNEEERAVKLERVVPFLLEDRLRERGARFAGAPLWLVQVVTTDRLVTGQNPASAAPVAEAMVRELAKRPLTPS
jgi:putative intracellular protease/amidase